MPGGCGSGSPQDLWLEADLAANSTENVIAIWHKPRYSSGVTKYQAVQPLWDDLYAAGVDILLVGHDHIYERFAPIKSGATLASPPVADPTFGIRAVHSRDRRCSADQRSGPLLATSEVRNSETYGVLKLTPPRHDLRLGFPADRRAAPSPTRAPDRCTPPAPTAPRSLSPTASARPRTQH